MGQKTKQLYEFGSFTLDVEESRLLRNGQPVPLKPKVFETLLVLVENTGHVMDKEGLMERLWPDSYVEEANLKSTRQVVTRRLSGRSMLGWRCPPLRFCRPRRSNSFPGKAQRPGRCCWQACWF